MTQNAEKWLVYRIFNGNNYVHMHKLNSERRLDGLNGWSFLGFFVHI